MKRSPLLPSEEESISARVRAHDLISKPGSVRLGGVAAPDRAARLRELGRRGLPPFPSSEVIRPAIVPAPKCIPLDADVIDAVKQCVAAYRAAVEARWPELGRCYVLSRGDIRKSRDFEKLKIAAEKFRALEISPAAWCMFSADVWKETGITKGPPTLAFVFSDNRIEERLDWFEDQRARYCGGQTYFAPEHLALADRWQQMWDDLLRKNPQDHASLMDVVEQWFPGRSYEVAVELARKSSAQLQKEINEMVEKGVAAW